MRLKLLFFICICTASIFLFSCESKRLKQETEIKAKDFLKALKNGDESQLVSIYPNFATFDSYLKSDSARIESIVVNDNFITVSAQNKFTNGFGKQTDRNILLFFKRDSLDKISLEDSRGLFLYEEVDEYVSGIKAGCINTATDTTDQQILKGIKKSKLVIHDRAVQVYAELQNNISVVSWEWESGYGGSASGKGIVSNKSTYSVPQLKYKIIYKTGSGNEITTDDGYVSYDVIEAGERKSFTFYTSYSGDASKASIELIFDEEPIFKYLKDADWTGNECWEYFKKNPEQQVNL